ncbi:MAG: peptidase C13 [Burkholderiales bacterium]|nr:peptidase C13 [Burkholderiales bacterium]
MAFFLDARRAGFAVDWTQAVLLTLLWVLATFAHDVAETGLAGELNLRALPATLSFVLVVIVAAWAMAAMAGRTAQTLALVVAILSAGPWIDLSIAVVELLAAGAPRGRQASLAWVTYYAHTGWLVACVGVAGARMLAPSAARGVAMAAVGSVLVGFAVYGVDHSERLWTERIDTAASARAGYDAVAAEDALYLQPRLLDRELAALLPRREGRPNLYLVGVAGYADQDVFMREVGAVDTLFAERFGTRGRSVRLVNNRATVRELPLATRTSLAWTLERLGGIMHRDEDVLFLFLTSHGTRNHLALEFPPLRLADLSAAELRRMLDESGIRNRVIVVSSCYSGGFIEALRDDYTLVMTASAGDRNSFGCSNEADFTYFGKAYFDEALRGTDSFTEAFDRALPAIAAREKKDDYPPSQPQRYMGREIGVALAALRDARARESSSPAGPAMGASTGAFGQLETVEKGLKPVK